MGKHRAVSIVALLVVSVGIARYVGGGAAEAKADCPRTLKPAGRLDGELVEWISEGEEVDLDLYLADGVRTVVEFTADW